MKVSFHSSISMVNRSCGTYYMVDMYLSQCRDFLERDLLSAKPMSLCIFNGILIGYRKTTNGS